MTDRFTTFTNIITTLVRNELDHHDMSKQDILLALAVGSAFVFQREPHHPQDDLDDFRSKATETLLAKRPT